MTEGELDERGEHERMAGCVGLVLAIAITAAIGAVAIILL